MHDNTFIRSDLRLYMTATPRLFSDETKSQAKQNDAVLASMDDESVFGPEFHRLGFGEAVERDLLTDYKVLILTVDEQYIAGSLQSPLADENNEIKLDDAVKIVGCWNGLAKRSGTAADGSGFPPDAVPMQRAVAFARDIRSSKKLTDEFGTVIGAYRQADGVDESVLRCTVRHVDGTFNALERNTQLDWLKAPVEPGECRILSNARCLSEGVDVPSLDAVLFLNPRNSVVDVVQAVGRVMRKAPGKDYGYIILPVGIPSGVPADKALSDNQRYKVVWQVLQALRAHDDRFNATINKIDLNRNKPDNIMVGTVGLATDDLTSSTSSDPAGSGNGTSGSDGAGTGQVPAGANGAGAAGDQQAAEQLSLISVQEWRDAIYAKIVAKVGERTYWENWAKDIAVIAEHQTARITALLADPDGDAASLFDDFLKGLRDNLNDGVTRADAIDMLAQHLITKPVFDALFEGYEFTEHNPVSLVMQAMLEILHEAGLEKENATLRSFYASVRTKAGGLDNAAAKQTVIKELYEKFFKTAFPRQAEKLGIVYTPVEVVDFIIRAVNEVLVAEFGASLSDPGVHVLDPFTGGTSDVFVGGLTSGSGRHAVARSSFGLA